MKKWVCSWCAGKKCKSAVRRWQKAPKFLVACFRFWKECAYHHLTTIYSFVPNALGLSNRFGCESLENFTNPSVGEYFPNPNDEKISLHRSSRACFVRWSAGEPVFFFITPVLIRTVFGMFLWCVCVCVCDVRKGKEGMTIGVSLPFMGETQTGILSWHSHDCRPEPPVHFLLCDWCRGKTALSFFFLIVLYCTLHSLCITVCKRLRLTIISHLNGDSAWSRV